MLDLKRTISEKVKPGKVLMFDLDGTLVDTDYANSLAYKNAISEVLSSEASMKVNMKKRFNRETLKKEYPELSSLELNEIVKLKEINYINNLTFTKLITKVSSLVDKYSGKNKLVLITQSRKARAEATLRYHNLLDKFDYKFFGNDTNKFKNALETMDVGPEEVIVFENDMTEYEEAINAGIPRDNILLIKNNEYD